MDHGLEIWDIAYSWIISRRDLASTIKSVSAASFRSRAVLFLLAALPADISLITFGVEVCYFLSITTERRQYSRIPNQVNIVH